MRHELIAAAILFALPACEKKATNSPDGVTLSASSNGNSASTTVPTSTPPTTTPTTTPELTTDPGGGTPGTTTGTSTTPPPAATGTPAVKQADAEIKGMVDAEKMRAAATSLEPQLLTCYNDTLTRTPGWTGRVVVRFIVGKSGKTLSADLAEPVSDNKLADCVITAAKKAKLPKPGGGKDAIVSQPFEFSMQ